jgi:hypothetical protein
VAQPSALFWVVVAGWVDHGVEVNSTGLTRCQCKIAS